MHKLWNFLPTLVFILLHSQSAFAVGSPLLSGSISRGASAGYFDLSIVISDISKNDLTTKEKDLFKDRLRIWLPDAAVGANEYVPFEGDPTLSNVPFTLSQRSFTKTTNSRNLTDFTYEVRISQNSSGALKQLLDDKGAGKTVKVTVKYYEDLAEISKTEGFSISVNTAVVQDAPSSPKILSTHKSLVITWSPTNTTTWTDSTSKAPLGMSAVAIRKSSTTVNLPAYIYDSSATSDSEAGDDVCSFNTDYAEGTSCVNCSNSNAYLNLAALESVDPENIFVGTSSNESGVINLSGLNNDEDYAVFVFYQPGGLNRSTCVTASPKANKTWSEINGEDDAKLSDPKCFIATAAYGSPLHKNLLPLRWFRDHVLSSTTYGRIFIDYYYKFGPRAAAYITDHPLAAFIVRQLLWIPVSISRILMMLSQYANWVNLIIFAAFSCVTYFVIRIQRPKKAS